MKKVILSFIIGVFAVSFVFAQTTPIVKLKKKKTLIKSIHDFSDSVKYDKSLSKDSIKCAPDFPLVKADDIIYSKRIWRDVFFVENANRYLSAADPNKNIIRIILDEVRAGKMDGYSSDEYDLDVNGATIDGSLNTLGIISDEEFSDYEMNVKFGIRIMEDWYFDKNRSEFKPFIVSIGVIVPNQVSLPTGPALPGATKTGTGGKLGDLLNNMQPIVWINYPSIRERLCKYFVSHPNDQIKYSFDDVLQLRYFTSVIIKESNIEDIRLRDRKDLVSGLDKLLEADRIKKSLIQYEQDMWQH